VPDGHITVVPNQFIITEMDLKDKDYYMASENIHEVAKRNNLWDPAGSTPFNFLKVYGWDYGKGAFGCTRRTWRVFTLAAPSLEISPFTDGFTTFGYGDGYSQPYPFSVKPDKQLTLEDIMAMTRDTYEGSLFDLGKGLAAGPFGDVMRYEAMPTWMDAEQGVIYPDETADANGFERAISLYRTVYASIAQARSDLPDEVGGVVWIAPNAPHHSSFVPVYASPDKTPSSINRGNQHVLDKKANYWAHSVTANYVSRCEDAAIMICMCIRLCSE
jgi:dipeptidase